MKNKDLVNTIHDIFVKSKNRYGYRRITMALRNEYGWIVNHKKVLRLMKRFKMSPPIRKAKYKSYRGEIGKVAKNILKRDFKANRPNKKWVTDVTNSISLGVKYIFLPSWIYIMTKSLRMIFLNILTLIKSLICLITL